MWKIKFSFKIKVVITGVKLNGRAVEFANNAAFTQIKRIITWTKLLKELEERCKVKNKCTEIRNKHAKIERKQSCEKHKLQRA